MAVYYYASNMKYQLDTIPIWDAYEQQSECPLCLLEARIEKKYIQFFLGSSVMNPEMRISVNKTGFCPIHYAKLFEERENRHGLGLLTYTHMQYQRQRLKKQQKTLEVECKRIAEEKPLRIAFQKDTQFKKSGEDFVCELKETVHSCMICERIENTLKRYAFTIVHLWRKNAEFRSTFEQSKGFCYYHLPMMIDMAFEVLPKQKCAEWLLVALPLQEKQLIRLEDEINGFNKEFSYTEPEKVPSLPKEILHRAIQKLTGQYLHGRP